MYTKVVSFVSRSQMAPRTSVGSLSCNCVSDIAEDRLLINIDSKENFDTHILIIQSGIDKAQEFVSN